MCPGKRRLQLGSSGRGNAEGMASRLSQGAALQVSKAGREHLLREESCTSAHRWKVPIRELGLGLGRTQLLLAPHPSNSPKAGFQLLG